AMPELDAKHPGLQIRNDLSRMSTHALKKLVKKFAKKSSSTDDPIENLNEDSKKIIHQWAKMVRAKYKNDNNYDDDDLYYEDPLLLIEWNDAGLNSRRLADPRHTKMALVNLIRGQPGYLQFPPTGIPSECSFSFVNTPALPSNQALVNTIGVLVINNWSRHAPGIPDVGRVYEIYAPRKGQFHITEHQYVFNL
ncbi:22934_t:CDS:2, partial [Entrophospora sp. SA101]